MGGATLDAGALIAIERGSRRMQALLDEAAVADAVLAVPAGLWRRPGEANLAGHASPASSDRETST